jgi:hypothetical protein
MPTVIKEIEEELEAKHRVVLCSRGNCMGQLTLALNSEDEYVPGQSKNCPLCGIKLIKEIN